MNQTLVIYNEADGRISQTVVQAEGTLEALAVKYTDMGIKNVLVAGSANLMEDYVYLGALTSRPKIEVLGEDRSLKADNQDYIEFEVNHPCKVKVFFQSTVIHEEDIVNKFEIATPVSGLYELHFEAEWPWVSAIVQVKADAIES